MKQEALDLLVNFLDWHVKAEEREIYELEASVGDPPLRKKALAESKVMLQTLKALTYKFQNELASRNDLTEEEARVLGLVLAFGVREEERAMAELSADGGNKSFIPACEQRREWFKEIAAIFCPDTKS